MAFHAAMDRIPFGGLQRSAVFEMMIFAVNDAIAVRVGIEVYSYG
jgi:hypothetical protein